MCLSLVGGNMKTSILRPSLGDQSLVQNLLIYLSYYHQLETNPNTITSLFDQCGCLCCDEPLSFYSSCIMS